MTTQLRVPRSTPSSSALLSLATLWALGILGGFVPAWGQVELTEIPLPPQLIEPGLSTDYTEVFVFRITDIDPWSDDDAEVIIQCFLVQNLGTATEQQVVEVEIFDETESPVPPFPVLTAPPSDRPDTGTCPAGALATSPVTFEAFGAPSGGIHIPDEGSALFRVAVRAATTDVLGNGAQGKSVLLRVTLRVAEQLGGPPDFAIFDVSLTDSKPDTIFNGGINDLLPLSFVPFPIPINGVGVVSRFRLCDRDSNLYPLKLEELIIGQGPLGSAHLEDFSAFELWQISGPGSPLLWGEIASGAPDWASDYFNHGGIGIPLPITTPGAVIPDDSCLDFEIRARTSYRARVGHTVHLWVHFATVREPPEAPNAIDLSVAPLLQTAETVMLGSGVLRIPDVFLVGSTVPIEVVGFPPEGLGRVVVQTNSVQFDPNVIRIEGVEPVPPYQVQDVTVDNRRGLLRFSLIIDPNQLGNAATGVPLPQEIARLQVTPRGRAGERSPLIFQVDRVEDAQGNDITPQVLVVSGSVTLLPPGDVDLLDGMPTVRDALLLAQALLGCLGDPPAVTGLTDEQKRIADVAEPKAPPGTVPDCTTLTSADVAEIARLALLQGSGALPALRRPPTAPQPLGVRGFRLRCDEKTGVCRLRLQGDGIQSTSVTLYDAAGRRLLAVRGRGGADLRWLIEDPHRRPWANGVYLCAVEVRTTDGRVWRTVAKVPLLR